ncbi:hypothetical protein VUR80DRAFT_2244 [Thermomyces stellatus]
MAGPIFVCGATGTQGGAVARHLRKANVPVHALVRDPSSAKAKDLEGLGVTLFPGSFDDDTAMSAALKGTQSAFLNFVPNLADSSTELRHARAVLSAAKNEGVRHIVYASSFGLDQDAAPPMNLEPDGLVAKFYQVKKDIVKAVVSAGFESYTILRPAKFMSDLLGPNVMWFGDLAKTGTFETVLRKGEPCPWVDPNDIGAFGAAALLDPGKFGGEKVDIFTEMLTIDDVIGAVARITGKKLGVRFLTEEEEAERVKKGDVFIQAQAGMRGKGTQASLQAVKDWGVPLGSYAAFLEREKPYLLQTYAHLPDAE